MPPAAAANQCWPCHCPERQKKSSFVVGAEGERDEVRNDEMAGACQGESQWNIWNVFLLFHTGNAQPELTSSSVIDLSDTVPISKCLFSDIIPFSLLSPLESSCFSRPMKSSHCFGVRPNTSLVRFHSWSQQWLRLFSSSWVTKESPHGKIIARQTAQADLCPLVQNRIPLWEWSKLPFFFPYRSAL